MWTCTSEHTLIFKLVTWELVHSLILLNLCEDRLNKNLCFNEMQELVHKQQP